MRKTVSIAASSCGLRVSDNAPRFSSTPAQWRVPGMGNEVPVAASSRASANCASTLFRVPFVLLLQPDVNCARSFTHEPDLCDEVIRSKIFWRLIVPVRNPASQRAVSDESYPTAHRWKVLKYRGTKANTTCSAVIGEQARSSVCVDASRIARDTRTFPRAPVRHCTDSLFYGNWDGSTRC